MKCLRYFCLFSLSLSFISFTMENEGKEIEKQAWSKAYEGKISEAIPLFEQAAEKGNFNAAYFLKEQYAQGKFTAVNPDKANCFGEKLQKLMAQEKAKYGYCFFDSMSREIIDEKSEAINTFAFMRKSENEWYVKIWELIKSNERISFFDDPILPRPEKGLCKLFRIMCDKIKKREKDESDFVKKREEEYQNLFAYLKNGLKKVESPDAVYECILDGIIDAKVVRYDIKKELILLSKDWSIKNQKEKLQEAIHKIFRHERSLFEERQENFENMLDIMPLYAEIYNESFLQSIQSVLKDSAEWIGQNTFKIFSAVKKINESLLDKQIQKILNEPSQLHSWIKELLENPQYVDDFENTSLSLHKLFKQSLNSLNKDNKIIGTFLSWANDDFLNKYEKEIIQAIPKFLRLNSYSDDVLLDILHRSTHENIKRVAFESLVVYAPLLEMESLQKYRINRLLAEENNYFKSNEIAQLGYMLEQFTKSNFIYGLERIWVYLAAKSEPEYKKMLCSNLICILGLTEKDIQEPSAPFSEFLNAALKEALQLHTKSTVNKIVEFSSQTKLDAYIDKSILEQIRQQEIFEDERPVNTRITQLNDLLVSYINAQKIDEIDVLKNKCEQVLVQSPFKQLVTELFNALYTKPDSYKNLEARRKIEQLCEENGEFIRPRILFDRFGVFFNGFRRFQYMPKHERPAHISVKNDELKYPILGNNGLVYGFQKWNNGKNNRVYACDATGWLVWQYPIENKNGKLVKSKDWIYLVDGNKITQLDQKTGAVIRSGNYRVDTPIKMLELSENKLFSFQDLAGEKGKLVTVIDLESGKFILDKEFKVNEFSKFFVLNDTIAKYEYNTKKIYFYDSAGNETFSLDAKINKYGDLCYATIKNNFYFQKKGSDKRLMFTCFDYGNNKLVWEIPLLGKLKKSPIVDCNGERMFVLTDQEIMALSVKENHCEILWKVSNKSEKKSFLIDFKIEQIILSEDEKTIYGVNSYDKELYSIKVDTGQLEHLYTIEESVSALLGTFNGKLYIC